MKTNSINNINYRAGYTSKIAAMEKRINPRQVEAWFKSSKYKDWGDFKNTDLKDNKAVALANKLCARIFINFRKIYDLRPGYSTQNHLFPRDLYALNEQEQASIPDFDSHCVIKCIGDSQRPLKDKPAFYAGTLLFSSDIKSLEQMNGTAENEYLDKWWSSNHYLHTFVHDWLHSSFCLTLIHRARNEEFDYKKTIFNYDHQQIFTAKEKEIVSDVLGRYALSCEYGQYQEVYAEAWAKFICEALAEDCVTFKKNPLDILKSTPKEFQEILKKVSKVQLYNFYGAEIK